MRPPIRGALTVLLRKSGSRDNKRIDWTLVLAWAGIAVALSVVMFVLAVR